MTKKEVELFQRMTEAQESMQFSFQLIAAALEKQQPSRMMQIFIMGATIATALGIFGIIDIIKGWIGG